MPKIACMSKLRAFFSRPFVAGLAGGLVVGLLGLLAITAGWIKADSTSTTTVASTGGWTRFRLTFPQPAPATRRDRA